MFGTLFIGKITLGGKNGLVVERHEQYETLMKRVEEYIGTVCISLEYNILTKTMTVAIHNATDLTDSKLNSYIIILLYTKDELQSKQKTMVQKNTNNPIFEETFHFKLTYLNAMKSYMQLLIKSRSRFGIDQIIGTLIVGVHGGEKERKQWLGALALEKVQETYFIRRAYE